MLRKLTILIVVCLFAHTTHSQNFVCDGTPFSCTDQLNFTSVLPLDNTGPFTPNPANICPGQGGAHNTVWHSFAAGSPSITIQIDISNCTTVDGQNGPLTGVQAGIYEDCAQGSTSVVCEPGCFDDQIVLSSTNFIVGNQYYIFFDGCAGSVCDISVSVTGGSTIPPSPGPVAGPFNGPNGPINPGGTIRLCENAIGVPFSIPTVANASEYDWTLPLGAFVVNGTNTESITVNFGNTGGQVCVNAFSDCYSPIAGDICFDVVLETPIIGSEIGTYCTGSSYPFNGTNYTDIGFPLPVLLPGASWLGCDSTVILDITAVQDPPGDIDIQRVCDGEFFICPDGIPCNPGLNQVMLPSASWRGCDSLAQIELIIDPPTFSDPVDIAICEGEFYTACNLNLSAQANYQLTAECGTNFNGCDTTVFVNLVVMNPIAVIGASSNPPVIGCDGASIVLDALSSTDTDGFTYEWSSPDITADICSDPTLGFINVCAAGEYCLTVRNSYFNWDLTETVCISQQQCITITGETEPPMITQDSTDLSCVGASDGIASVTVTNPGSGNLSYIWQPGGETTSTITGLSAGSYSVTVSGSNGCTTTTTVMVNEPTASVTGSASETLAVACFGESNGEATASPSGGDGTYTYLWCNGQTGMVATGLGAGSCSVTITDGAGCTAVAPVTITELSAVTGSASETLAVACFGESNGEATATPGGGDGSYTYLWCNGQTGMVATGLGAGSCSVTITDGAGCTAVAPVTITELSAVTGTASETLAVACFGELNGEATATPGGGDGSYTYLWCNGQTGMIATGLGAGSCSVTITDGAGCTAVAPVTITETSAVTGTASETLAVACFGESNGEATATPGGGDGTYTYLWCNGQTGMVATGLGAGSCSVTITDGAGCTAVAPVTITETSAVTGTASETLAVACFGELNGEATATPGGGDGSYTYLWCNGQTGMVATGLGAGSCSVTITDGAGCTAVAPVTITELSAVTGTASETLAVACFGESNGEATATPGGGDGTYTYLWCNGQTGMVATGLGAGTCSVTITDGAGCTAVAPVTITETTAVTGFASESLAVACFGESNGEATATPGGGDGTYTYLWCNGQTGMVATGLGAGTCSVTITDGAGCTAVAPVTITEPTGLDVTPNLIQEVSCVGGSDGQVSVSVSGGNGTYTYIWCNGQTGSTATGLQSGPCSVTISDGPNCGQVQDFDLAIPSPVTASVNVDNDVTCFGESDGEATATAGGGNGTYTYLWCNGATGQNPSNLPAGNCSVTITDGNGCSMVEPFVVNEPAIVTASASGTDVTCFGESNGEAIATPGGGDGNYTYEWCDGQTGDNATGLSVGICVVTITDGNGCFATADVTISEPTEMTNIVNKTDVTCVDGSDGEAFCDVTGGSNSYTYQWCNGQTSATATGLPVGICFVTITDANATDCFIVSDFEIEEPEPIQLNTGITEISCTDGNDGTATVTADGGTGTDYTYLWCNGQTAATATGLAFGTCTVTVSDISGCTEVATINLENPEGLTLDIASSTNVTCNGADDGIATVQVDGGSGSIEYRWCNDQTNPTATNLAAGTCTVTVTDGNGCSSEIDVEITQPVLLTVESDQTEVSCNDGNDGTATVTPSGGTGTYTYQWCNGSTGSTVSDLPAGTCSVEVRDERGCLEVIEFTITEPALLELSTDQVNITCFGEATGEASVTAIGGNGDYTYAWCGGQSGSDVIGLGAGFCEVTVSDGLGCSEVAIFELTEPDLLEVSINGTNLSCNGAADGQAVVVASGGGGNYTYEWCDGQNGSEATGLNAGVCFVTVSDQNNCFQILEVDLTQPSALALSITGVTDASCNGETNGSVTVEAIGGDENYTYEWSDASGQFTPTANSLGAGTYFVTVTDGNNCFEIEEVTIDEPATALSASGVSSPATCEDNNGAITVDVQGGTGNYNFDWNIDDLDGEQNPSALGPGLYTVTVTDQNNCEEIISVNVDTPSGLEVTPSAQMVTCNGGNNGEVSLTIVGGNPPYGIAWDVAGFDDETDLTGLGAGSYNATITDLDGCNLTASATVSEPDELIATVTSFEASCGANDGAINLIVEGGSGLGSYTYEWDGAPNVEDPDGLSAGIYNVTVTDQNNCIVMAMTEVTVPDAPELSSSQDNVTCNGGNNGSIALDIVGGQEPYQFLWNDASLNGISDPSGLAAGSYSLTVVDDKSCEAFINVDITEPEALIVTPQITAASCNGALDGAAVLDVSGGIGAYTYEWCGGQTGASVSNLAAGNCTVTVSDGSDCVEIISLTIDEPAILTTQVATDNANCNGASTGVIDITVEGGTGPYVFTWSETGLDANAVPAGTYDVTISDANNCDISLESILITEPDELILGGTTEEATCGELNGSISLTVSGGLPPYTYDWVDDNLDGQAAPVGLAPGSYGMQVIDANDCIIPGTFNVETPSGLALQLAEGTDATCAGGENGSIELNVEGGSGSYTFDWNDNDLDGFEDPSGLAAGDYFVTISDTDGCSLTASVAVNEPQPVTASGTATPATCGSSNGTIDLIVGGGSGIFTYDWDAANDIQDPTDLAPGTYTVTVTDDIGCTAITSVEVITPGGFGVTPSANATSCNGVNDGSILLDVAGATGPYSFAWSDSNIGDIQNPTGLAAGTYAVTVTDDDDCPFIATVEVPEPDAVAITTNSVVQATCANNDGGINISVNGGDDNYTFNWSSTNIGNVQNPSGLSAGNYTVTVIDGNGCSATISESITIPDAPSALSSSNNILCNGESSGSIALDITGGTAPYDFTWSDASIGNVEDPTGLPAGAYEVTISDVNSCTSVAIAMITEPMAIQLNAIPEDALCGEANGSIDLVVSGGNNSNYAYAWDNGLPNVEDQSGLTPGNYSVTVTDGNNCTASFQTAVSTPAALEIQSSFQSVTCFGGADGSITLSINGADPADLTFDWNDDNLDGIENPTDLTAGIYIVVITDADGCAIPEEIEITQPTQVQATGTSTDASCGEANGSIDLTPTGGTGGAYTYEWDNGLPSVEDPSGVSAGNYNVTITDGSGCTTVSSVAVTTPNGLAFTPASNDVSCFGDTNGSIALNLEGGTPPFNIDWDQDQYDGESVISNLSSGTYSVVVTDADDCSVVSTFTITQPDELFATANGEDTNCNGGNDGSVSVAPSGGSGTFNYQWGVSGVGNSNTATGLSPGTYEVTITDSEGCSTTTNASVGEPIALSALSDGQNTNCFGASDGSIDLNVSGGTGPYTYDWNNDELDGLEDPIDIPAGVYSVIITDANDCTVIETLTIEEPMGVAVNAITSDFGGFNLTCSDATDGSIQIVGNGGMPPYTYLWNTGDTTDKIEEVGAGTYQVEITDANGCTTTESINLVAPQAISASFVPIPTECFGEANGQILLEGVDGGTGPYLYAIEDEAFSSFEQFFRLSAGEYTLHVQDANGCEWEDILAVPEAAELIADFTSNLEIEDRAVEIQLSDSVEITATFNLPGIIDTFYWLTTPNCEDLNCLTQTVKPTETTNYGITVIDERGCIDSETIQVKVRKDRLIYIPTGFAPEGNFENSRFKIYGGKGVAELEAFRVFNRWGEVVYEERIEETEFLGGDNWMQGWDGTFRSKPMNPGVFVYYARVRFTDNEVIEYQGDITLLR